MAWQMPPVMMSALNKKLTDIEGSIVISSQRQLLEAIQSTLKAIETDVQTGLLETVGITSRLAISERCSMIIDLPAEADPAYIAKAIDMENVEAWCDENGKTHVAVGPWYSTKDVDQVVLSVIKVVHVLLGLHASAPELPPLAPKTFKEKLIASVMEIWLIQKRLSQK